MRDRRRGDQSNSGVTNDRLRLAACDWPPPTTTDRLCLAACCGRLLLAACCWHQADVYAWPLAACDLPRLRLAASNSPSTAGHSLLAESCWSPATGKGKQHVNNSESGVGHPSLSPSSPSSSHAEFAKRSTCAAQECEQCGHNSLGLIHPDASGRALLC